MNVDLDPQARLDIAALVYKNWSESFDRLKVARALTWESAGKFCPKVEWPLYHASMVKSAEQDFMKASHMKDSFCPFSPLVIGS